MWNSVTVCVPFSRKMKFQWFTNRQKFHTFLNRHFLCFWCNFPISFHFTSHNIPYFSWILSIPVNRTSKASELDAE